MFTLNVGCGLVADGDVNCDLYIADVGHRKDSRSINVRGVENFVLCDAHFLPFKDGAFDNVSSSHVVEHLVNPFLALSEMVRVSCRFVTLVCPHRLERMFRFNPSHVCWFGVRWFYSAFECLGCDVEVRVVFRSVLGGWFPFVAVPNEIRCLAVKRL